MGELTCLYYIFPPFVILCSLKCCFFSDVIYFFLCIKYIFRYILFFCFTNFIRNYSLHLFFNIRLFMRSIELHDAYIFFQNRSLKVTSSLKYCSFLIWGTRMLWSVRMFWEVDVACAYIKLRCCLLMNNTVYCFARRVDYVSLTSLKGNCFFVCVPLKLLLVEIPHPRVYTVLCSEIARCVVHSSFVFVNHQLFSFSYNCVRQIIHQ